MKTLSAKKFLASVMAVLVLLTSLSIGMVSAETEGDFEYEICSTYDENWNEINYIEITGYTGSASELVIPSEIQGLPVESIDYGAFVECTTLTSVTIPDSVTSVGDWAFRDCENLQTLNLPDTLTYVGASILRGTAYANNEANWENGLLYFGKYLIDVSFDVEGDIEIKEGTELIAGFIFCYKNITSVTLPESLKIINDGAFSECNELTSVELPDSLETIDGFAFSSCDSLTEIVIPESVKNLGINLFANCTALKSVTVPEGIELIPSSFANGCESLKSFTIPSTVKNIDYFAFEDSGIETINIPAGVTTIGSEAFADCKNLTSITVDSANTKYYSSSGALYEIDRYGMGDYLHAYPAGKADEVYTLPETVTDADSYAFVGVTNLKKIVLHESVYDGRFYGAYSVEAVEIADTHEYLYDIDGVVFDKETNMLIYYPSGKQDEKYTVPEGTVAINPYAFADNSAIKEVTISEGADSLESGAFANCENLKTVNLPSTLTYIDSYAFDDCDNLSTINFNGTKAQWDAAFEEELYIDSTVGLTLVCTDGTFELAAPVEDTDPTEGDTGTTATEPTEGSTSTDPTETTPEGSTSTDPTEGDTGTTPPAELLYDLGDANMDGKLNIRDATAIQKHLAKIITLDETALELADFTQDGKVNIKDATNIQKRIAGII